MPLSSLDINSCGADSTCGSQSDVCLDAACTGVMAGYDTSWVDPFSGHASSNCNGSGCSTTDAAVEVFIPWSLIGDALQDGQSVFLQFGSYPSGPAQAPKDTSGANGISCTNTNNTFQCYRSTPTAVSLSKLNASSRSALPPAMGVLAAVFGLISILFLPSVRSHLPTKML